MRTDIYDATCSAETGGIAQCRLGQSDKVKRRHYINLIKFVPHLRTGRGKVAVRYDSANTSIIDQYVELPPGGNSLVNKPDPVSFDSKIRLHVNSLLHFGSHSATRTRRISGMEHHCIACQAEYTCNGCADAGSRSRNQRDA